MLINTAIIREPLNWATVVLVVLIASIAASYLHDLIFGNENNRP